MTEPGAPALVALRGALDGMGQLVQGVRPDQWSGPSTCAEWDVRALVNHVVFGNRSFTGILTGQGGPPQEQIRTMRDQDQLGDDPVAAWRDSAAALLAAFSAPGVLEQSFRSPFGPMPGAGLAGLRLTETLVHGWDVAHSTRQPPPFDDAVAQVALDFTLRQLPPEADRSSFPFAPAQPVPADAPAIDRLAAHLGRAVEIP
jgi:uncharacterized protein (TIGR03086 family)